MLHRAYTKHKIIKQSMLLLKQPGLIDKIVDLLFFIIIIIDIVFLNQKPDENYFRR
jgi:hypothetical protein